MIETEQIPLQERKSWLARILLVLSTIVVVIYGCFINREFLANIYLSVLGIVLTPFSRSLCIFAEELYKTRTWNRKNVSSSLERSFKGIAWKPILAIILIDVLALINRRSLEPVLDIISILSGISVGPLLLYLLELNGGDSATHKLETSSNILKGKTAFIKQLQKWLGKKCKWNLCYRASRHGWSAQDFHKRCDNKGPTVVLVKAINGCIFGGYTDQHWDSNERGIWKSSNSSFLFSLRNKENLAPFIAKIKQGEEQNAIYCYVNYGPSFGRGTGHDLHICNDPQLMNNWSHSIFGVAYELPSGYLYGSEQAYNLLSGQRYFHAKEIEVFN